MADPTSVSRAEQKKRFQPFYNVAMKIVLGLVATLLLFGAVYVLPLSIDNDTVSKKPAKEEGRQLQQKEILLSPYRWKKVATFGKKLDIRFSKGTVHVKTPEGEVFPLGPKWPHHNFGSPSELYLKSGDKGSKRVLITW